MGCLFCCRCSTLRRLFERALLNVTVFGGAIIALPIATVAGSWFSRWPDERCPNIRFHFAVFVLADDSGVIAVFILDACRSKFERLRSTLAGARRVNVDSQLLGRSTHLKCAIIFLRERTGRWTGARIGSSRESQSNQSASGKFLQHVVYSVTFSGVPIVQAQQKTSYCQI
ncbi:hypothetical protein A9HBioS_0731 [Pseudomonas koreensis]|uniref:Uncharacterized protein n=1 Tax=Pseudomonas koreensis TaxID=198620 RepID=A0AA94ERK2_9PSED|nr:hypothetical protein A9HBioS_0731 [Pseudomonas koreensis]